MLCTLFTTIYFAPMDASGQNRLVPISALCSIFSCWVIPFMIAFDGSSVSLWVLSYMSDAFLLYSVCLGFHLESKSHKLQCASSILPFEKKRPFLKRMSLCRRNFLLLLSLVPLEIFAPLLFNSHSRTQSVLFLRVNRLARAAYVMQIMSGLHDMLSFPAWASHGVQFGLATVLSSHWMACIWSMISDSHEDQEKTLTSRYMASLYWSAVTLSTTGYGDIVASNNGEMVFSIVSMITGALLFGYLLGGVASTLANQGLPRSLALKSRELLLMWINSRSDLLIPIKDQVLAFLQVNHSFDNAQTPFLSDLLPATRALLLSDLYMPVLQQTSLLRGFGDSFLRELSSRLQRYEYLEGEQLTQQGQRSCSLFIIQTGHVRVVDEQNCYLGDIEAGGSFGGITISLGLTQPFTTIAASPVVCLQISRAEFAEVLSFSFVEV
jgi:hypothetical protein